MIKPTVSIMHDRRRADRLPPLIARLTDDPWFDDNPAPTIADGTYGGPWLALFKSLYMGPADATHTIIVEDDAIPARNFITGAYNAIRSRPDDVLYLFASERQAGDRMRMAAASGCSWSPANIARTIGTVAAVIPRAISRPFIGWACTPRGMLIAAIEFPEKPLTGDARFFYWMGNVRRYTPLVASVNIADHDESDVSTSLIGTRQMVPRRSPVFIGSDSDAGAVVWNSRVWDPPPPTWQLDTSVFVGPDEDRYSGGRKRGKQKGIIPPNR